MPPAARLRTSAGSPSRRTRPARQMPQRPGAGPDVRMPRAGAGHPVMRGCGAERQRWARGVLAAVTFTADHALSTVLYSVLLAPYRSLAAFRVATRAWWKSVVETM